MTIGDNIYRRAQRYARLHNISVEKFVEKAIADIVYIQPAEPKSETPFMETEEFKKALEYMDTLIATEGQTVPDDEDGKGALAEVKYAL